MTENKNVIWKDIEGYEGLYQVSNTGLVKSLARMRGCIYTPDKILNGCGNGKGYIVYDLYDGEKRKKLYGHRIVAKAFIEGYSEDLDVNHKDFNRSNNNCENLELLTHKENVQYSISGGRYSNREIKRGSDIGTSKLTEDKVLEIRELFKTMNVKDIAIKFDIHWSTVYNIIKRKSWKHV